MHCSSGLKLLAPNRIDRIDGPLDTLVVAGGPGSERAVSDTALLRHLRRLARSSRRIASICSGAFILAAAGLLDGKRATTHWEYADDLATALELERLDRDLFRGINTVMAKERSSLFGGQVCAQALMAAGLTVDRDRLPHSLHGYFLRPGQIDKPVLLQVDRDRDGRSFSARHVDVL